MSRKPAPKSREVETTEATAEDAKALTVTIPSGVLHRAKARASLEGSTMSAVVTDALAAYAEGLQGVLANLGLNKPAK